MRSNNVISVIAVLFLTVSAVHGLKCYSCHNDDPTLSSYCLEDFEGEEANCTGEQYACWVYHTEYDNGKEATFGRSCVNPRDCVNACGKLNWVQQAFVKGTYGCSECCFESMCNKGSDGNLIQQSFMVLSMAVMFVMTSIVV
ncbi:uncharacterized protein LOC144437881 [Glandiceps talaboti]